METESKPVAATGCGRINDATLGFWLLRLWLGIRAVVTGLEKFSGTEITKKPMLDQFGDPDISGAMVEVKEKVYGLKYYHAVPDSLKEALNNQPLLAGVMVRPFYAVLGWALLILGITLLLGICTRATLFLMGLIYVALTVGLILLAQDGGVAWLGTHIALVVGALLLAKHNRFEIVSKY